MFTGVQGLNMSFQYGGKQCQPPPNKCKSKKCLKKYYKSCKPQWSPTTVLGAI